MNLNINKIVSAALRKAKELRTIPPCTCNQRRLNIPMGQGVYLFYKGDKIIYVGQAGSLKKRISCHMSAGYSGSNSILRKKIVEQYRQILGPTMKQWIMDNCSLSWLEIEDKDIANVVEYLLVASLRKPCLLNK